MKKIQQYILSLGFIGLISAAIYVGTIDPKTGFPAPITVDGQTINFTWTDDNTGEDLIIYTDKATYDNSLSEAEVYVAIENKSGVNQDIELLGYFRDTSKRITDIHVLTELVREREEPVYTEVCTPIVATTTETKVKTKVATSTCASEQTGTQKIQYTELKWIPLPTIDRTIPRKLEEDMKVAVEKRKPVENFVAERKSEPYEAKAGEVTYYKVRVKFPPASADNFYFEALGSQGAMGHLDPWFDSNWNYRVKVEVNRTKVGTTTAVTSFPVYLDLDLLPTDFWSNVNATGSDIRVVESDETTETPFELVTFATTTTTGELHFLADALATTSTSTFYIYYGNPSAAAYATSSTYGASNVWTKYSAVYHFQQSSGNRFDSASSSQTMTNVNVAASTTSKIYTGSDFEHSSTAVLNRADSATYDFGEDFSITGWFNTESIPASGVVKGLIAKDDLASARSWSTDLYNNAGSQKVRMFVSGNSTGSKYDEFTWTRTLTTNNWFHLAFTYDISNSRATRGVLWENNVSQGSGSVVNAGASFSSIYNGTALTAIGNYSNPAFTEYYDGVMDEIRFSRQVFDLAWITTEYNNQSSPSTFVVIGAQESEPVVGGSPVQDIFWFDE